MVYYSAPKQKADDQKSWTRSIRKFCAPTRSWAFRWSEQKLLAGVAVDAVFDSVSVATTFKEKLAEAGVIFCSFSEAVQKHPELVQKYLGSVVPYTDNFFAALNCGGVQRRVVLLRAQGRALPDGAFDVFPHQCRGNRAVRAHADRRRRRRLRQLPGRLHGADPRREPAARRGGRAGGAGQRADQVLDRAELVSRRQGRQGRHLQFRHQARQVRRAQFEDLLDAGGDRLGHHLEVSELHPAGRQLGGRVLLGGADQQLPAGRHRHQDDPHRQEHAQHHRLQGHLAPGTARTPIAAW